MAAQKPSKRDLEKRYEAVIEYLLDGLSTYQIVKRIQNSFNVNQSTSYRYIKKCKSILAEESTDKFKELRQLYPKRVEKLYRKALEQNDLRLAARILNDSIRVILESDRIALEKVTNEEFNESVFQQEMGQAIPPQYTIETVEGQYQIQSGNSGTPERQD